MEMKSQMEVEPTDEARSYTIIDDDRAVGGKAIRCELCGRTSYHPMDVREKYCGHCRRFHDDTEGKS